MSADRWIRWVLKPAAFAAGLVPLALLVWRAYHADLGANPLTEITHETGDWTIRFIVITLAITPVRRLSKRHELIRFRRMAGLFAFFYGSLHFLIYVVADRFAGLEFREGIWAWSTVGELGASIWEDVYKRPYITIGFTSLVGMLPLAMTSTAGWIRRLGGRNWNRLHRLVYLSAVAAVIHYWWLVKADILHPAIYGVLIAVLLGFRAVSALNRTRYKRRHAVHAGA
jgi:sulfoxide reductase heme-binding subunit YedZ